jgi:hypothetical protein
VVLELATGDRAGFQSWAAVDAGADQQKTPPERGF